VAPALEELLLQAAGFGSANIWYSLAKIYYAAKDIVTSD